MALIGTPPTDVLSYCFVWTRGAVGRASRVLVVAEAASHTFHRRQQRSLGAERDARQEELCLTRSRSRQPKRIAAPLGVHVASSIEGKAALDEPFVVEGGA